VKGGHRDVDDSLVRRILKTLSSALHLLKQSRSHHPHLHKFDPSKSLNFTSINNSDSSSSSSNNSIAATTSTATTTKTLILTGTIKGDFAVIFSSVIPKELDYILGPDLIDAKDACQNMTLKIYRDQLEVTDDEHCKMCTEF
jgi:hypothetical protein